MTNPVINYQAGGTVSPGELQGLFSQADWARHRTPESLETMLRLTTASVTARSGGALIGYARAITDGVYRAVIDDVVVDTHWRGHGIGRELVERLLRELAHVEEVRLNCRPELVAFYEGMGFGIDGGPQMRAVRQGQ